MNLSDFNLAGARAATAHLRSLHEGLRTQIIFARLVENRRHHKARAVDDLLASYRFTDSQADLDAAEALVERHSRGWAA